MTVIGKEVEIIDRFIAIDDKCAWPNLTLLPGGEIAACIFGEPTHGAWQGDAECWVSADGGYKWEFRGVPAPHEPGTNRMNLAAGPAGNGDLIVLCSGWDRRPERGEKAVSFNDSKTLMPWVCRSSDGGRTWDRSGKISLPEGVTTCIPFGDVVRMPGGRLAVAFYSSGRDKSPRRMASWVIFSGDDGRSWGDARLISDNHHGEPALFSPGGEKLVAALRTPVPFLHLDLFFSGDGGETWQSRDFLTGPGQIPGHLLRLADGRILLTCGARSNPVSLGVLVRTSADEGATWDAPAVLMSTTPWADGGYPSTVQLADGTLVTAYYCSSVPAHRRYHMGVIRWKP